MGPSPRCPQTGMSPTEPPGPGIPLFLSPSPSHRAQHPHTHPHHSIAARTDHGDSTGGDGTERSQPRGAPCHPVAQRAGGTRTPPSHHHHPPPPPPLTAACSRCPWGRSGDGRGSAEHAQLSLPGEASALTYFSFRITCFHFPSPRLSPPPAPLPSLPPTAPTRHAGGSPGTPLPTAPHGSPRHRRGDGVVPPGPRRAEGHRAQLGTGTAASPPPPTHTHTSPHPPPPGHPSVTSLARSELDGSQPGPSLRPRSPRGSAGCGHAAQRGDAALPQGHGSCGDGSPAPTPHTPPPPPALHWGGGGFLWKGPSTGGVRALPGAPASSQRCQERDFCVVSSSTAAPKEKFLLRLRTPTHPPGPGCGAAPTALPHFPPPTPRVCALGAFVCHVCTEGAWQQLAEPRPQLRAQHCCLQNERGGCPAKPSEPPPGCFSPRPQPAGHLPRPQRGSSQVNPLRPPPTPPSPGAAPSRCTEPPQRSPTAPHPSAAPQLPLLWAPS